MSGRHWPLPLDRVAVALAESANDLNGDLSVMAWMQCRVEVDPDSGVKTDVVLILGSAVETEGPRMSYRWRLVETGELPEVHGG